MPKFRLGDWVQVPDGRVGTVVFNGLRGQGVKWGKHFPQPEDFDGTSGDCLDPDPECPAARPDWPWEPDAMLRDKHLTELLGMECVGDDAICDLVPRGN